jgi:phytoene desaturase
MNYADMSLGTWYPTGGMYKIIEGMVSVAKSLGVKFEFDSSVQRLEVTAGRVSAVVVNNIPRPFDYIIASGDYHHIEQNLLAAEHRMYSRSYWEKRVMAPSCLIFYLGINKRIKNLLHHTLFFDEDFKKHSDEIYTDPQWPSAPQFYVSCPSKSDSTVAPAGSENIFILIPVASGLEDTDAIREKYFKLILRRMEHILGEDIQSHIVLGMLMA